jgi:hypothetical protein
MGVFSGLVGLGGIEPPTSPLSGVRSSHLSYRPGPEVSRLEVAGFTLQAPSTMDPSVCTALTRLPMDKPGQHASGRKPPSSGLQLGGAGRDRTGDLLNANQALSQLSYSP